MQCPECKGYRHEGPCPDLCEGTDDSEFELEQLAMDADAALERYLSKLNEVNHERRC